MSVLIKGMEMPKNCAECRLWSICECLSDFEDYVSVLEAVDDGCLVRDDDCPLTEVKDRPRDSNGRFSNGINDDWVYIEPLDGEEWKPIQGYEDRYKVSNMGRIRSRTKILATSMRNKYAQVTLSNGDNRHRKQASVHRLVAEAFVENPYPNEYKYVNHKDENKRNNKADNLEWCTASYNLQYGTCRARMAEKRRLLFSNRENNWFSKSVVCVETGEVFCSIANAAEKYGIDKSSITKVCNGNRKTAGGMRWKYVPTVIEAEGET